MNSAVKGVIETAQPSIDFTQRKYGDAHDAVVASATYNRALEAAAEVLQRVQVIPARYIQLFKAMKLGTRDGVRNRGAGFQLLVATVEADLPFIGPQWHAECCAACHP